MSTNNSVNVPLSGSTGTGTFVGSNSPTMNLPSANNFLSGYTTTATAAGTTTLTVASTYQQYFTGSTTQTVVMPVTSTLVLGQAYYIVNNSSGAVTVQSSGANTIQVMAAGSTMLITCILTSGTSAASWNIDYQIIASGVTSITGTANQVIASAATGAVTLSLPQSIATTSAVTFGSVAFSPTTQGIVGTTAGTAAAAGYVGEIVSSVVLSTSPVTMPTNTNTDITSISLTAGDWIVYGLVNVSSTSVVNLVCEGWISNVSTGFIDRAYTWEYNQITTAANIEVGGAPSPMVFNLTTTTTIYLVAWSNHSAGSSTGCGHIIAQRFR